MEKEKKEFFNVAVDTDLDKQNVVYSIDNNMNGNKYVGVTTQKLKERLRLHLGCHSKSKMSSNTNRTPMYLDLNKYGPTIFTVSILYSNSDVLKLKEFEKEVQKKKDYKFYSSRERARNTLRYREYTKVICTSDDGEKLMFESQAECGKHFGCGRDNVAKALSGGYKLKRKYTVSVE